MDGPSSSRRKRPFHVGDDAVDNASEGVSRDDCAARCKSDHSGHVTVSVDRVDDGSGSERGGAEHDSVYGEGRGDLDANEIAELRRALEYLVTGRDVENMYNADGRRHRSIDQESSQQPNGAAPIEPGREKTDDQLYMIPNLVNRVLMEHYSTNYRHETSQASVAHPRNLTIQQKETLTQLLLAVIVEFTEPHFVRVALRQERERKKLLLSQQRTQDNKKTPRPPRSTGKAHCAEKYSEFDDRAVSWATACIHQLIQPPASSPEMGNESNNSYCLGDGYNIPALDALLAASGPHDGMVFEKRMQSALMNGLQDRRLLKISGLLTQNRDS
jgi:hypothetical protein